MRLENLLFVTIDERLEDTFDVRADSASISRPVPRRHCKTNAHPKQMTRLTKTVFKDIGLPQ